MPGMPDIILKAPVFKRISAATRIKGAPQSTVLAGIINDLKNSPKSLADIAISAGMYHDHDQAEHLNLDWLDTDPARPGFWRASNYKVEELVRKGILNALELFQKTGKPIDLFWAISGPNMIDPWNVAVAECPEHIVVIFFTPNVPCPLPVVDDYSIWITEQDAAGVVSTRNAKRPAGG
jgi:hypothetical protein